MRNKLYILFIALIAVFMAYSVGKKEYQLKYGKIFYLALAPVDPRSMMQGDYMTLNYAINNELPSDFKNVPNYVFGNAVVLEKDANGVAGFVSFYSKGQALKDNQFKANLIRTQRIAWTGRQFSVAPQSFMFQEGKADLYDEAKYGILKYSDSGEVLLIGLADGNFKEIK